MSYYTQPYTEPDIQLDPIVFYRDAAFNAMEKQWQAQGHGPQSLLDLENQGFFETSTYKLDSFLWGPPSRTSGSSNRTSFVLSWESDPHDPDGGYLQVKGLNSSFMGIESPSYLLLEGYLFEFKQQGILSVSDDARFLLEYRPVFGNPPRQIRKDLDKSMMLAQSREYSMSLFEKYSLAQATLSVAPSEGYVHSPSKRV